MAAAWDVAPCTLVVDYQRFRGHFCLHYQENEYANHSTIKCVAQSLWPLDLAEKWLVLLRRLKQSSAMALLSGTTFFEI